MKASYIIYLPIKKKEESIQKKGESERNLQKKKKMVLGWRRAFCTSVPRERDSTSMTSSMEEFEYEHVIDNGNGSSCGTTKLGRRFGFFSSSSNPSTPPLRSQSVSSPSLRCRTTVKVPPAPSSSVPVSPKLHCETKNSPRCFLRSSTPSSPRSPSPFTFLKSSLRLCTVSFVHSRWNLYILVIIDCDILII